MLTIYNKHYYISVDNAPWRVLGASGICMLESSQVNPETIVFENLNFEECYNTLQREMFSSIHCGTTEFLKKPVIYVGYAGSYDFEVYKHFNTISYKITCEEYTYCTLHDIMRRFPADQTIQYLKERGMAACPLLKE
jgi:hypothetical protein